MTRSGSRQAARMRPPTGYSATSSGRERGNRLVVHPAEIVVDREERLQEIVGRRTDLQLRGAPKDRRHHTRKKCVVNRNPARSKCFRKHAVFELRAGLIAGHVARHDFHRRIRFLVVQQREKCHLQLGIFEPCARAVIPRIELLADSHSGFDVARRRTIHNHLRTTHVHVVMSRDDAYARGRQPHLDVA